MTANLVSNAQVLKLELAGPIQNGPSTKKLHHFERKRKITCDTGHVTHDMWHVTCNTWHVTCNIWGGRWTFSQNVRSLAQTVWEWRCLEYLEEKDEWINEWINHKSYGTQILGEGSPPPTCHVSWVTFYLSHVMCHV